MKFFLYDNVTNEVTVNEPEILLIKEFKDLWASARNKTKEDPKGIKRSRAFRELTYIWLMLDWSSPYADYTEHERHVECMNDAKLKKEEWEDPKFLAACRKYRELQNSSRVLRLIKTAQGMVDKITDYFEDVDLQERDPATGKPIFKTKDVMNELSNVSAVVEELKTLEVLYKKEQEQESGLIGNQETGAFD